MFLPIKLDNETILFICPHQDEGDWIFQLNGITMGAFRCFGRNDFIVYREENGKQVYTGYFCNEDIIRRIQLNIKEGIPIWAAYASIFGILLSTMYSFIRHDYSN